MTRPTIVSIQSQLVFGCAGNNAAVPLLQRLGARVYTIPTALLSNTPHYPSIAGGPVDPALIDDLLARLLDRVAPTDIDAILTGYIGSTGAALATARFIDRVRDAHPDVVVLCDPVMGDIDTGPYVEAEVAETLISKLVPRADILTPNLFAARRLVGAPDAGPESLLDALLAQHFRVVAVTGIEARQHQVRTIVGEGNGRWTVVTPRLDLRPTGTGDVFSAAFLHRFLGTHAVDRALEAAVDAVFALLEACRNAGAAELEPDHFVRPESEAATRFRAEPMER